MTTIKSIPSDEEYQVLLADPNDPDDDGGYAFGEGEGEEWHKATCPCELCRVERLELMERVLAGRPACEGEDCQGCGACAEVPTSRPAAEILQEQEDFWQEMVSSGDSVLLALAIPPPEPLPQHLQRLTRETAPKLPPMLERDDGETVLYEGKLNTLVGEPGQGKTWAALMAAIASVRRGSRVVWWDFEDKPATLATRLDKLGAGDLVGGDMLVYAHPSLADDADAIQAVRAWAMTGERVGLVVIDSAESAGCATDSNNVLPWYEDMVNPWLEAGCGVLLLDHVPKRREDRPRGGIGSQHKLARIDGAALFVSGQIWTKTEDGAITLRLHKDRQGDLPAVLNKPVCTITGQHVDGVLQYAVSAPNSDADDDDMGMRLLHAIAITGSEGIKGMRKVRESIKDAALSDLIGNGLVEVVQEGRANVYFATDLGIYTIEHADG